MKQNTSNQISLMSLFKVGAHRGNRKSKSNPRLKGRIYGYSRGLALINLVETKNTLDEVSLFLRKLGEKKRQVLIVGTSKHIQDLTKSFASQFVNSSAPYVNSRWLGGTLTNWTTVKRTLKTLEKFNNMIENKEFYSKLSKNEQLAIVRKRNKINKFFEGLVDLRSNKPGAVIVLDANKNDIAIKEAESARIPVIALTNTNTITLPKDLSHTIVCNINSTKAVDLILSELAQSYNEGYTSIQEKNLKEEINTK